MQKLFVIPLKRQDTEWEFMQIQIGLQIILLILFLVIGLVGSHSGIMSVHMPVLIKCGSVQITDE